MSTCKDGFEYSVECTVTVFVSTFRITEMARVLSHC